MKMPRKVYFFACLVLFWALSHEPRACDTRHFYNTSSVAFTYAITPSGSCSIGSYTGPICVIPPGETADLHYPLSATNIAVSSNDNGGTYPGGSFSVSISCSINHSGDTGNI